MNIYVVVDGEYATKKIYQNWIPLANRQLKCVDYLNELTENNFIVYASQNGYPGIWSLTEKAIEDANNIQGIDRIVVCVDSEDEKYSEVLSKAQQRVKKKTCKIPVKIVIQHFCLETWLLGNINLFHGKTKDKLLQEYYTRFDIRKLDPADLPDYKQKIMNRAHFAYYYLLAGIKHTHGNKKYYNKRSPGIAQEETFYNSVYDRCKKQGHIQSFNDFLNAFL
jgi:hypothetical protein